MEAETKSAHRKVYPCASYLSTFKDGVSCIREKFCDAKLVVGGRIFEAHKIILAANSKYFYSIFVQNFNERNSMEIQMPPEIAPEAMETLLDYFYSGDLTLSESNINLVFQATDYMRLDTLLDICAEYMKETLDPSNTVQRFVLAETIPYSSSRFDELKKASSALILSEVEEITKAEDFLNLSRENISKILNSNNQPTMAESLYMVILKWISHDEETRKQFLYDLLQTLPVEGISDNFLTSKMRNEELLRRDLKSVLWVMDAMSRLTITSLIHNQPSSFIYAGRDNSIKKCFLVKKGDNPMSQAINDRPKMKDFSAVSYKKQIYLFCGEKTEKSYQLSDPNESWIECNLDLKFGRRDSAGCVVINDELFVVGGYDWKNDVNLNSCMKFNFCSGQKQSLPAMKEKRGLPGVAVYANSLYAACGYGASPSIERFDPREGRWSEIGEYTNKIVWCSAATVADFLYCCCGANGTFERFDFRKNCSQEICSLPINSRQSCWISYVGNDLIGALGERIFIYDAVTDKWNDFCCATDVPIMTPIIVPWV